MAGPSGGALQSAVIKSLDVAEGDWVEKDQIVARLNTYELRQAEVDRLKAILANAKSEMARQQNLARTSSTSESKLDAARMNLDIARADLAATASWNSGKPTACMRWPRCMRRISAESRLARRP